MSLITVAQISNGQPLDATPVNQNFSTLVADYNGNVTDANVSSTAGIQGTKLLDGSYSRVLGYAQVTGNSTYTSTTAVQLTGLTLTVTVPPQIGNHLLYLEAFLPSFGNSATAFNDLSVWDGVVGTGTQVARTETYDSTATGNISIAAKIYLSGVSGSKTYNVGISSSSGTVTVNASATAPAFLVATIV